MTQIQVSRQKLIMTSSLNKYYLCDECGPEKRFKDKKKLQNHISRYHKKSIESLIPINTEDTQKPRTTRSSVSQSTDTTLLHICQVCQKKYLYVATLRYHIRRAHFNLISKTPYYQQKKVNQIWFEKVQNSDTIIEVHKTGVNSLVFRRLSKNTAIKVNDADTDTVDLSNLYPTFSHKKKVKCDECKGDVLPNLLLTHKLKHQRENEMAKLESITKSN